MNKYLSVRFNRPAELIAFAVECMISQKDCVITISQNEYKDTEKKPDFVSKKVIDCGVWVKESKY